MCDSLLTGRCDDTVFLTPKKTGMMISNDCTIGLAGSRSHLPVYSWVVSCCVYIHLGVSINGGTTKWRVYEGKCNQNGRFGGTPISGNHHILYSCPARWACLYGRGQAIPGSSRVAKATQRMHCLMEPAPVNAEVFPVMLLHVARYSRMAMEKCVTTLVHRRDFPVPCLIAGGYQKDPECIWGRAGT